MKSIEATDRSFQRTGAVSLALFLVLLLNSSFLSAGHKFKIPPVTGRDPTLLKFTVVEYSRIREAFRHPTPVMRSLIEQHFEVASYEDFLKLPLHSQIFAVKKLLSVLAIKKENRGRFLKIHFHNQLSDQDADKVVLYSFAP